MAAMLMQVHDEDGSRMTDEELIGQTGTLFIAGHETTATALTWTLFLLAQHPQVLRALRDELAALGGDAPALDQPLPLLDGVIKESLRLFPPLNLLMRVATSPFELGGYALPAGANIVLSGFVTHRIEPVYDQPYRFMPERWQTINPSPYEFMPFGGGARMCIGAPFAMMEMKLVLPLLLQRYQFTLLPKSHIDAAGLIFTTPKNHLPMRIDLISGQLPERVQVQGNVTQFVRLESA